MKFREDLTYNIKELTGLCLLILETEITNNELKLEDSEKRIDDEGCITLKT